MNSYLKMEYSIYAIFNNKSGFTISLVIRYLERNL